MKTNSFREELPKFAQINQENAKAAFEFYKRIWKQKENLSSIFFNEKDK